MIINTDLETLKPNRTRNISTAQGSADYNRYFQSWEHYKDALALSHTLEKLGIKDAFYEWANKSVDFLHESMVPQKVITMAHNLVLLLQGHLRKYYSTDVQAIVILEALKFCVGRPSPGLVRRYAALGIRSSGFTTRFKTIHHDRFRATTNGRSHSDHGILLPVFFCLLQPA